MVKEITIEVDNTITNETVRDYLWNYPKWITKEFREKNNIWDILINWIVCLKCKDFVRSRNAHDFRMCKYWAVAIGLISILVVIWLITNTIRLYFLTDAIFCL